MNLQKLVDKMSEGIILLEYTSLISGTHKVREVTTNSKYIPEDKNPFGKDWRQDPTENDKIICFDVEFNRWDDIDIQTIVKWQEIENKSWKVKQAKLTDLNWDGNEIS
tara:strand:+ start:197 stop:520 length:324 start_codon:yes stop_codon:yes gene_type:complete